MRMSIPLRRMNYGLRIGLPVEYIRKRGLRAGDQIIWEEDENGIRVKILRVDDAPEVPMPDANAA
jgi:hypothetical protein